MGRGGRRGASSSGSSRKRQIYETEAPQVEPEIIVLPTYAAKPKKKTSWVYMHLQKNEQGDYNFINGEGRASFKCGVMASKFVSDRVNLLAPRRKVNEVCGKFIPKLGGNTSGVINHLRKDHNIVPPTRETEEVVGPMSLYLHKKRSTSTLKILRRKG